MINKLGLHNLIELTNSAEKLKEEFNQKKHQFEKDNELLISKLAEANHFIEEIKDALKQEALVEYSETNQKKLTGGLGIRVSQVMNYPEEKAFEWAKEHSLCLKLDSKAFETIAKTQEIDFVTKEEKITVTFPSVIVLED